MRKVLTAFVALALHRNMVTALTPAAGKCKHCDIPIVPVTFDDFAAHKPWKVLYVTEAAPFGEVVSDERDGFRLTNNQYIVEDSMTIVCKICQHVSGKTIRSATTFSWCQWTTVIIEDSIGKNGKVQRYYTYPLAKTIEYGFLFYRCSDNGQSEVDTRYIWIPRNETLSDTGLNHLMEVDRKCNFRGKMHKLPK